MRIQALRAAMLLAAMATTLSLLGCGGGGGGGGGGGTGGGGAGGGGGPPAGANYFPLAVGDTWYYDGASSGANRVRVTGTRDVGGRTVFVLAASDSSGSGELLYESTSEGVFMVAAPGADAVDRALASIPILRMPIVVGQTREELNQTNIDVGDLDGDGRPDLAALQAEVTVVGYEPISTAAGAWSQTVHLTTVLRQSVALSASGQTVTLTATADDWYAPDVGLVRSEYSIVGDGVSFSDRLQLTAFRAGALRSETVSPTMVTRSPASGSVNHSFVLQATFSEPIDREVAPAACLRLLGPSGPVPGSISWLNDRTLTFVPSAGLSSGSYVATVDGGLTDLVGNPVAGDLSWSFSLDLNGPVVVSVDPADGAVGVPLDGTIRIVFDEAPDPASVTEASVQLSVGSTPVTASRAVSGRTVTLTPSQPLERAALYRIVVSGVRDGLGNVGAVTSYSFRADTGRFALAQALPGPAELVNSPVIADFDADGRNDLAAIGTIGAPGVSQVYRYRQGVDGTLAVGQVIPVQSACAISELTAGDMNADGRADLVVTNLCGIEVLHQSPAGAWVTASTIPLAGPFVFDTQVLRGSGRPGVLASPLSGSIGGAPLLWRQDGAGQFAAPVTVPSTLLEIRRVRVADMNGDGLDDVVLFGVQVGSLSSGIEVRLQAGDGSFGPVEALAVENCSAIDIAAGDVNGDGRADLVLADSCPLGDRLVLLLQTAAGGFVRAPDLPSAPSLNALRLTDLDADGRADIAAVHNNHSLGVYLQRPDGSMSPEALYPFPAASRALAIGDLSGDGRVDVVSGTWLLKQQPVAAGTSVLGSTRRGAGALGYRWRGGSLAR